MRPSKTIKYVAALATNKVDLEIIKLWVEIFGLVAVLLTFGCYVWLAFLQRDGNEINRRAVEASQHSLELNQKSLAFAQQSIELTQRSLDLNQQVIKAAQDANEIARHSQEFANIPWVTLDINKVSASGDRITIAYTFTNHSDSPAVNVQTFLHVKNGNDVNGLEDVERLSSDGDEITLYPKQIVPSTEDIQIANGQAGAVRDSIYRGGCQITAVTLYISPLGNSVTCEQSFLYGEGAFDYENTRYHIDKMDDALKELIDNALSRPDEEKHDKESSSRKTKGTKSR